MLSRTLSRINAAIPNRLKARFLALRPLYIRLLRMGGSKTVVETQAGTFNWQLDDLTTAAHVFGTYELYMQESIRKYLQKDQVFYDVGSHAGFHALFASLVTGRGGQVYAFEPHPRNRARINAKLQLNPELPITCLPYALGDECGAARLEDNNSAQARVSSRGTIEIEIRTIDSLVQQGIIRPPDLMKIDVEGLEPMVLRGARETLAKHHPVILIDWDTASTLPDAKAILEPLGYVIQEGELITASWAGTPATPV